MRLFPSSNQLQALLTLVPALDYCRIHEHIPTRVRGKAPFVTLTDVPGCAMVIFCVVAPPSSATSVFDVADKIDEFRFQCPRGVSREQRFCLRTLFDNNRFFNLVYANEIFSVLRRVDSAAVDLQAVNLAGIPGEYESFKWKEMVRLDLRRSTSPVSGHPSGCMVRLTSTSCVIVLRFWKRPVGDRGLSAVEGRRLAALLIDCNYPHHTAAL